MNFIIAQICGVLIYILMVISVQLKSKEKMVLLNVIANFILIIEMFLLNAITGAVISILNTIRCFVFYLFKKKDLKPSLIVLLIFEVLTIVLGIWNWQNLWSLIPILITVIYTYGLWQDDIKIIRITTGISGAGWSIYDVVIKAYVSAIQEFSQIISSIIALIRNKDKKEML